MRRPAKLVLLAAIVVGTAIGGAGWKWSHKRVGTIGSGPIHRIAGWTWDEESTPG